MRTRASLGGSYSGMWSVNGEKLSGGRRPHGSSGSFTPLLGGVDSGSQVKTDGLMIKSHMIMITRHMPSVLIITRRHKSPCRALREGHRCRLRSSRGQRSCARSRGSRPSRASSRRRRSLAGHWAVVAASLGLHLLRPPSRLHRKFQRGQRHHRPRPWQPVAAS